MSCWIAPPPEAEATPPARSVVCDELNELRPLVTLEPLAPDEPGRALELVSLAGPLTPGVLGSSLAIFDRVPLRPLVPLAPEPLVPLVPELLVSELPAPTPLEPDVVVPALLVSFAPLVLDPRPLEPWLLLPLVPLVPRPLVPLVPEVDEVVLPDRPLELEELLPCVPAICWSC